LEGKLELIRTQVYGALN